MNKLKARREELNLTQKQVADICEMKESQYQGYERGRHEPVASIAIKLAKALKTSVEDLYDD